MRELKISGNDAGQRLNKYLMKYLDKATSSFVYKMLRKKNITLNGKKAAGDEILQDNDIVTLFLSEETIGKFKKSSGGLSSDYNKNSKMSASSLSSEFNKNSKISAATYSDNGADKKIESNVYKNNINKNNTNNARLKILYKTNDILAVHKDAGVLSQKAKAEDYSINEQIADYCQKEGIVPYDSTFKPSVCNRLDRNTSGIILAGISLKGSQYLSRILRTREVEKYYFAVVKGIMDKETEQKAYIRKDSGKNVSEVVDAKEFTDAITAEKYDTGNMPQNMPRNIKPNMTKKTSNRKEDYDYIETYFTPISSNGSYTFLKIHLITGKSHQIRAGLKAIGYPIIGDYKYGDAATNAYFRHKYGLKSQLLHAGQVILPDKTVIDDPLPKLFFDICDGENLE